jgi:hypothetical protein
MTQHVRKTKEVLLEGGLFNFSGDGYKSIIEVHMEALMAKIFQDNLSMAQRLHQHATAKNTHRERNEKHNASLEESSNRRRTFSEGKFKYSFMLLGRWTHDLYTTNPTYMAS